MNIDEYVKKSAQNIGSAAERRQFEKELKNHILDRVEYYTDAGYDEKTATRKALGQMGSPEKVSEQMGRVHRGPFGVVFDFIAVIAFLYLGIIMVLSTWEYRTTQGNLRVSFISEFLFLIIMPLIMLAVNRRGRHRAIMFCALVFSALYVILRFVIGAYCSQILFVFGLIISGQFSEWDSLISLSCLNSTSIPLIVGSIAMFVLIIAAETVCFISALRTPSRGSVTARKTAKRFIGICTVFCFTVTVCAGFAYYRWAHQEPFDRRFWICDVDEITDFETVSQQGYAFAFANSEHNSNGLKRTEWGWNMDKAAVFNSDFRPTEIKNTQYGIGTVSHPLPTECRRYVAVIPVKYIYCFTPAPDFENAKWFDTQETEELRGSFDNSRYCEIEYRFYQRKAVSE